MGWLPSAMQARKHSDGRRKRTSRPTPSAARQRRRHLAADAWDRAATNTRCPITLCPKPCARQLRSTLVGGGPSGRGDVNEPAA